MKKFLAILAIAGTLIACNDSADSTENAQDSLDSVAAEKKDRIDSSADRRKDVIDSTTEMKKEALDKLDSANRKMDTTVNK
ncbi:MAG: hypothetical protein M3352_06980 [Bacteroidota bacterium]|nr:hypothetical protein [Bacteroidota bacterium]